MFTCVTFKVRGSMSSGILDPVVRPNIRQNFLLHDDRELLLTTNSSGGMAA